MQRSSSFSPSAVRSMPPLSPLRPSPARLLPSPPALRVFPYEAYEGATQPQTLNMLYENSFHSTLPPPCSEKDEEAVLEEACGVVEEVCDLEGLEGREEELSAVFNDEEDSHTLPFDGDSAEIISELTLRNKELQDNVAALCTMNEQKVLLLQEKDLENASLQRWSDFLETRVFKLSEQRDHDHEHHASFVAEYRKLQDRSERAENDKQALAQALRSERSSHDAALASKNRLIAKQAQSIKDMRDTVCALLAKHDKLEDPQQAKELLAKLTKLADEPPSQRKHTALHKAVLSLRAKTK